MRKRKLNKSEKKAITSHKKGVKKVIKLKKQIATTLDWIDIENIQNDYIELKKDNKVENVVGIKIKTPNILLSDVRIQNVWLLRLKEVFNKIKTPLFHAYVYTRLNLDEHIEPLLAKIDAETDDVIRNMFIDDIEDYKNFASENFELSFFIMIKGVPGKNLTKDLRLLFMAMQNANFEVKILNSIDYDNLISVTFNNDLINDFFFSKCDFEIIAINEDLKSNYIEAVIDGEI